MDQGDGVYPSFIEAGLQTFQYSASAPHNYYQLGYMDVYITKSGWDSSAKLKWQDLEETPFCRKAGDIGGMSNHETFDCDVPARSGNHIIYVVWQRADQCCETAPHFFMAYGELWLSFFGGETEIGEKAIIRIIRRNTARFVFLSKNPAKCGLFWRFFRNLSCF